jgi:hypothetical protein
MNFNDLKMELQLRLGNRADLDARMNRWLNYAYFEILMNPRFQFFELDTAAPVFDTIQGQDTYTFEGIKIVDMWFILDIRDMTNERKLRRTHWSYIDKITRFQGMPIRYYRFGNGFVMQPIPDATYVIQVRYRRRPPDLTNGTDFINLGTEWEEPIITLASIKGFEALQLKEEAAGARQLLEGMFSSRIDVPGLEDFDSETTVEATIIPRV